MSNGISSNLPTAKAKRELAENAGACSETIDIVLELAKNKKPENIDELERAINNYFKLCQQTDTRPGIEALALACGVDRVSFWRWCNGLHCSDEWARVCCHARQMVATMTESLTISGKLSPPVGIFALKQHGWTENQHITIDRAEKAQRALSLSDLPSLKNYTQKENSSDENSADINDFSISNMGEANKTPLPFDIDAEFI